jgi:hypothetical protein
MQVYRVTAYINQAVGTEERHKKYLSVYIFELWNLIKRRPRPDMGCSAIEEEEEEDIYLKPGSSVCEAQELRTQMGGLVDKKKEILPRPPLHFVL